MAIGLVFGVAVAGPGLRGQFGAGRLDTLGVGTLLWVTLIRILIGTVLLEEIAFRGVSPAGRRAGAGRCCTGGGAPAVALLALMLVHLATNSGGVLVGWWLLMQA